MSVDRVVMAGLLSLCLFFSACGGGGDGDERPAPLPTGVVISATAAADTATPVAFTSDVVDPAGALTLRWEFGDGASSTEAAPSHPYQSPGDYEVTLTVTNEDGASVSGTFTVQVRRRAMVQGAACSAGEGRGWCWQRPLPVGNRINDLHFVDARLGWAVGEAGQVLKTVDGGLNWQVQYTASEANLTQVRFANATSGWALGTGSTILRTDDGGTTWSAQAAFPPSDSWWGGHRITVIDDQRALLSTDSYGVATTQDGGQTWHGAQVSAPSMVTELGTAWYVGSAVSKLTFGAREPQVVFTPDAQHYLQSVSMGSETTGLLVEYDWSTAAITWRRTTDGGSTWPAFVPAGLPAGTPYRLKATGASDAWAQVGDVLFHSEDAGAHWTAVTLPSNVSYWRVGDVVVHDSRTLGLPHETGYYLSTDAGAHWTLLQAPGETAWYGDTKLWLQGGKSWLVRDGRIHVTADLGLTWRQAFGAPIDEDDGTLTATWFFDDRKGMAVSSAGWLLETTDGGRAWQRRSLTTPGYTSPRLQFASRSVGWMSGADGISKTIDGGVTWWLPVTEVDMRSVNDFHFIDDNRGWALVNGRTVVRTTDGGGSWQEQFSSPYWMAAIRFIDADVGVMVGYGGAIMRTTDGGATWSLRPSEWADQLRRVTFVDAQQGWAVGGGNAVVRTVDGGVSWQRVAVPGQSTSLYDVRFVDPKHGWIVGEQGTVLATRDGGQTWVLQNSGTYRSLHAVFALDPFTAWAVGDDSTVLATATAGD